MNSRYMKALTIWQPWASLWACGAKKFETRSWPTSYRGPIAIHAATASIPHILKQMFPLGDWTYAPDYETKREFLSAVYTALSITKIEDLPKGVIVATADLIACHEIVGDCGQSAVSPGWLETDHGIYEPTGQELMFGDWTPGHYAWEIANAKMLDVPIPAKGKQGLWNWVAA